MMYGGNSFNESAIFFYLILAGLTVEREHRLGGYRLDMYLPDYKLAIEYDSAFTHSDEGAVEKDTDKNRLAQLAGIHLIRLRDRQCDHLEAYGSEVIEMSNSERSTLKETIEELFNRLKALGITLENAEDIVKDIDVYRDALKIAATYRKAKKGNITEKYPNVAADWSYDLNEGLRPEYYTGGERDPVWWKCQQCKKVWQARVIDRCYRHSGCPSCNHSKKMRAKKAAMQAEATPVSC